MIKGHLTVRLEGNAWINSQNKITAPAKSQRTWHEPQFILKTGAQVIMHHLFDVTDDIVIGERVTLAGDGTQIWSHAFFLGSQKHVRVDGSVHIGNDCYIGARCVICAGVSIADHVALGAGTVVSKSLLEPGLYVSQPLRYINYDADESIRKMEEAGIKRAEGVYEKMK
jgi:acetyltransferase-like isoleucine patch superfamily enzyme